MDILEGEGRQNYKKKEGWKEVKEDETDKIGRGGFESNALGPLWDQFKQEIFQST